MKAVDNLLMEGLAHYSEAMYAVRQFERSVDDIVGGIVKDKSKGRFGEFIQLFDQKKLDGGGNVQYGPKIDDMTNIVPERWWTWIGREYWIVSRGGCTFFIGLIMDEGRFSAAVAFTPSRAPLRDWLFDVLNRQYVGMATMNEHWEIIIAESLENAKISNQSLSDAIERALEKAIVAIKDAGGWGDGNV